MTKTKVKKQITLKKPSDSGEGKSLRNRAIDDSREGNSSSSVQSENARAFSRTGLLSYLKAHLFILFLIGLTVIGAIGAGLKYLEDDAQRELTKRAANKGRLSGPTEESLLNKINPFLPPAAAPATLHLSKEYIYAGSRLLAVEDAAAASAPRADVAVWRPSDGNWYVLGGPGSAQVVYHWGMTGDIPTPGDFDGDGKTDFAIWRPSTTPSNSQWWVYRSSNDSYFVGYLGSNGDIPVQSDYDGDGLTDFGTYTPDTGMWWIFLSATSSYFTPQFGLSGDYPAPADYDGDGRAEVAVWRNSDQNFYVRTESAPYYYTIAMGINNAAPVVADYDGDGKSDFAVRSGADWKIRSSSTGAMETIAWQQASDEPVPADYDGDGKADVAVWRNASGTNWYIRKSGNGGALLTAAWGNAGDRPVPAFYHR